MAQTTYNASVAYNAPVRYDGVTADVTEDTPPAFPAGRRHTQPKRLRRQIDVNHHTEWQWVVVTESHTPNEDELILLGLI